MRDTGSSDILMYCELDGLPPTVNHLYRSMRNGTRYKTTEGRKWQEGATLIFALKRRTMKPFAGDVSLEIAFYPGDNRAWDVDNRVKALQDCLAPAGIIKNDKQVKKLVVERFGKVEQARTLVMVRAVVAE